MGLTRSQNSSFISELVYSESGINEIIRVLVGTFL
jgi:hypothetical protein